MEDLIESYTIEQLLDLQKMIKKRISYKKISQYVKDIGYYASYHDISSDVVNDLDLVHCSLKHPVRLVTHERDNYPKWNVKDTFIKNSNKLSWERYLYIEDTLDNTVSFDAPSDQSKWDFGDWDDPIECIGTVEVHVYFKDIDTDTPIPNGKYLIVNCDKGIISVIDSVELSDEYFCEDYVVIKIDEAEFKKEIKI